MLDSNPLVRSFTTTYRSVDDFFRLRDLLPSMKTIGIVGGGFLGSELACALGNYAKKNELDLKVIQLYPEAGNMAKVRCGSEPLSGLQPTYLFFRSYPSIYLTGRRKK